MTEETDNPIDLSNLSFDLERSFQPAWALELEAGDTSAAPEALGETSQASSEAQKSLTKKIDKAHRRKPTLPRSKRHKGKAPAGSSVTSPDGQGNPREGKLPRKRHKPQPPRPEKFLPGWDIRILPEENGLDGLAKQIKISLKAYPLFDLARLILERPERFRIVFRRKGDTPLYHHLPDGTLWRDEDQALEHSLRAQFEKYYRKELVPCDPPKGNFPCVAQVGENGEILGPPNYHDYQFRLRRLYAEKYSRMPFEAFLNKIRMVRDPEAIEKWRQEQSVREEYIFIRHKSGKKNDGETKSKDDTVVKNQSSAAGAESTQSQENSVVGKETPAVLPDSPPLETSQTSTAQIPEQPPAKDKNNLSAQPSVAANPVEKNASPSSISSSELEQPAAEQPQSTSENQNSTIPNELEPALELRLKSYLEVRNHYKTHIFSRVCEKVRDRVTIRGTAAERSDSSINKAVRAAWSNLVRFPLSLAVSLGHALASRGVQLFKAHQNITYCSGTRPRILDRNAYPVSDGVSKILDYIEANPDVPRNEQWKALLAVRASVLTPDLPAEQQSENSGVEATLASELAWLLREGFIIDFARKGFQLSSTAIKNNQQKKQQTAKSENQEQTLQENIQESIPIQGETPAESELAPAESQPSEDVSEVKSDEQVETVASTSLEESPTEVATTSSQEELNQTPVEQSEFSSDSTNSTSTCSLLTSEHAQEPTTSESLSPPSVKDSEISMESPAEASPPQRTSINPQSQPQ